MMRAAAGLVLLAAVHAHAASAQASAYRRTPGDTLRYAELAEARTRIVGEKEVDAFRQESRVAITFAPGDTARAWFERLRITESGSQGGRAGGEEAQGLPFVLAFGPLGVDSTLHAPEFPASVDALSALLRTQFANFLPRLPGGPLRAGTEWADTLVVDESDERWQGSHVRTTAYRVVGDSAIGGVPVVVVELTSRLEGHARGGVRVPYDATTTRDERGRFYFAPGEGVLVRRTRSGKETEILEGHTGLIVRLERLTDYRSSIELISPIRE
jgi:hypothetical protein